MKINRIFRGFVLAAVCASAITSCTEQIKFGDSFIEKTPGGDITIDTIFNSAEYTQQFLTSIYKNQYYGLPFKAGDGNSHSYFSGQIEGMSDCWHNPTSGMGLYNLVYRNYMTAAGSNSIYGFDKENIWEMVHACYLLLENIDHVPDLDEATKKQYVAEAKCLMASSYFNLFRFYGGLPLVTHSYDVNGDKLDAPRSSVEKTVKFIVNLYDEAINSGALPFSYSEDDASSMTGHWTKAAAMAMKCRVLQFAASPLFNDDQPYYRGAYSMESASQDSLAWMGGKKPELWQQCKKACEDFLNENASNGNPYHLVEPTENTTDAYRFAYRFAYISQASPEVIFDTRVTDINRNTKYSWAAKQAMRTNVNQAYCPTQEYVEMFPWADGKPFNWEETEEKGELDHMFVKGERVEGKQELQNIQYTRDPRLYETVSVNGQRDRVNVGNGKSYGQNVELYVGGTNAGTGPDKCVGAFATGYFHNKYIADGITGSAYEREKPHWVEMRLSDIYLIYAEALLQADGNNTKALEYIDKIRARVGLKGLAECNPSENLTTNKDNLLEELLRERACELGFENTRYFDMKRYKRADLFSRTLHRLVIHRMVKDDKTGEWKTSTNKWYNGDRTAKGLTKANDAWYEPSHFEYERLPIVTGAREWWSGFDVKWYLFPYPQTEVIKGYIIQNPGW